MTQSNSSGNGNSNGNRHGATDEKVVISTDPISPNSKKTYVAGTLHPEIQVPFREITLSSTVGGNGNGNSGGNGNANAGAGNNNAGGNGGGSGRAPND